MAEDLRSVIRKSLADSELVWHPDWRPGNAGPLCVRVEDAAAHIAHRGLVHVPESMLHRAFGRDPEVRAVDDEYGYAISVDRAAEIAAHLPPAEFDPPLTDSHR